jgi:hypothetical protein
VEFLRDRSPVSWAAPQRSAPPAPAPLQAPAPAKGRAADLAVDQAQRRAQAPAAGTRLDPALAARFGVAFGHDFSGVTVVRDSADAAALGARAFAQGQQISFAPGEYQPGTPDGDHLVAHELAHVVQQSQGAAGVQFAGGTGPHEGEADRAAAVATGGGTVGSLTPAPPGAPQRAPKARNVTPVAPGEVDLSSGTFAPDEATSTAIADAGSKGALVLVKLPGVAEGSVKVRKDARGAYHFVGSDRKVPITGGPLASLASLSPSLVLTLGKENALTGFVAPKDSTSGSAFAQLLRGKDGPAALGWIAVSHVKGLDVQNSFTGGAISVSAAGFSARFGNLVEGTASFAIDNTKYSFDASLTLGTERFKGFTPGASFEVHRTPEGKYTGSGKLGVDLGGITTSATVTYNDGEVGLIGTLGVRKGVFAGSVSLVWADPATVRQTVSKSIPAENLKTPPAAAPAGKEPGPRQLAGIGNVSANLSEWLSGEVTVVVDGAGHVTVVGEFAPPVEIILFPQKDYTKELFKVEARAKYGVPVIGNVFVFANASLAAVAKLGPLKIYKIKATGVFSTDSTIAKSFTLEASLNLSAFAGLRLRLEGGVGLEILGHDIKAGVGVQALAGIEGYVEATPKIGVREKSSGGPEFFLDGHAELGARPVLVLSGDLFLELDSPWWSPAPDKKWTWPLGSLEYPLGGEFGIAADVSYVFGSKQLPEVKFGEVDFDASKFTTDLMEDKAAGGAGGKGKKPGKWGEGKGGDPKGKGKGKGGGDTSTDADLPPEARWYGPIGGSETFSAEGESHRTWIDDRGDNATIMVASTPTNLEGRLAAWDALVTQLEAKDQSRAKQLIGEARALGKKLDKDADKLAALKEATKTGKGKAKPATGKKPKKGKKENAAALNRRIRSQQKSLASRLRRLTALLALTRPTERKLSAPMAGGSEQLALRMSVKVPTIFASGPKLETTREDVGIVLREARERSGKRALAAVEDALAVFAPFATGTVLTDGKVVKRRWKMLEARLRPVARAVTRLGKTLDVARLARGTRVVRSPRAYKAVIVLPRSVSPTYERLVALEARRQLAGQATGMSKLTIDQWMTNVNAYKSKVTSKFNKLHAEGRRAVLDELQRRLQAANSPIAKTQADIVRARQRIDRLIADWDAGKPITVSRIRACLSDARVARYLGRHGDEKEWRQIHTASGGVPAATGKVRDAVAADMGLTWPQVVAQITAELKAAQGVAATQDQATKELKSLAWKLKDAILHNPDQYLGGKGKIPPASVAPKPAGTPPPGVALPPAWKAWEDYVNGLVPLVGVRAVNSAIGNNRTGWGPNISRIVTEVRKNHKQRGSWALWRMWITVTTSP